MRVVALDHTTEEGWSNAFPDLDGPNTFVLVFGAPEYIDEPMAIKELVEAYPESHVIGCSTAGEIMGTTVRDNSLAVAVVQMDRGEVLCAWAPIEDASASEAAGETLGAGLDREDLVAVIVLSEGIDVNGTELARGLATKLGDDVVITGGLAADGDRFGSTWILADGVQRSRGAAAIGIYGDSVEVGHGFKGGLGHLWPRAGHHPVTSEHSLRAGRSSCTRSIRRVPG